MQGQHNVKICEWLTGRIIKRTLNTSTVTSFPVATDVILKNSDSNTGHHTEIRTQPVSNKNPEC